MVGWCRLGVFSLELAREYISYLQSVPKYEDDPRRSLNGELMSAADVQNHVRVLRPFSPWLHRGEARG